jgi:hypothetical protein
MKLPLDLWREIFSYLDYYRITKIKQTCKYFNNILNEKFYKYYCLKYNYDYNTNFENSVILNYLGQNNFYSNINKPGKILGRIQWMIKYLPININHHFPISERDENNGTIFVLTKELNNIIFENDITIVGQCLIENYETISKADYVNFERNNRSYTLYKLTSGECYTEVEINIKPNTPAGISLKHLLKSIYRLIFDFKDDEELYQIDYKTINQHKLENVLFDGLEYDSNTDRYEIQLRY